MKKYSLQRERDYLASLDKESIEISPKFQEKWYDNVDDKAHVSNLIKFSLMRLSEAKKQLDKDKYHGIVRDKIKLAYQALGNAIGRMSE